MKASKWYRCSLCGKVIDINLDPDYIKVDHRKFKTYYHSKCYWDNVITKENKRND